MIQSEADRVGAAKRVMYTREGTYYVSALDQWTMRASASRILAERYNWNVRFHRLPLLRGSTLTVRDASFRHAIFRVRVSVRV